MHLKSTQLLSGANGSIFVPGTCAQVQGRQSLCDNCEVDELSLLPVLVPLFAVSLVQETFAMTLVILVISWG